MKKSKLHESYSCGDNDDEHIYDSISDFDQIHFRTHSMSNVYRVSCTSFMTDDLCRQKRGMLTQTDSTEHCWQQYWDW